MYPDESFPETEEEEKEKEKEKEEEKKEEEEEKKKEKEEEKEKEKVDEEKAVEDEPHKRFELPSKEHIENFLKDVEVTNFENEVLFQLCIYYTREYIMFPVTPFTLLMLF